MRIELPWPPSVNRYWRRHGHTIYLSNEGRAYRKNVVAMLYDQDYDMMIGPIDMVVELHPPTKRLFDVDNFNKGPLDALAYAKVYSDDSQIVHLDIWKREKVKGGMAVVTVQELT